MGKRLSHGEGEDELMLPGDGVEMYTALLQMQQKEKEEPKDAERICQKLPLLLPSIASDMLSPNEEISSLALRSLGYLTHHPKIVDEISDERATAILLSLSRLVISTDMKAVCNLGVWCLGIQQFKVHLLDLHCETALRAVIHAIENPMGSFSVTFEALQVVVILVQKLPDKMKALSTIWAPPVYKRLLSSVRIEREIAERCLKEVESVLLPPQAAVAKIVASDIKELLLQKMEKMVKTQSLMVPTIRAWGWLMRLLGVAAGENRTLLNQMLKIAELTYISQDAQVRIATLVAWEALMDALLPIPKHHEGTKSSSESELKISLQQPSLKRLKLLMTPLTNVITNDHVSSVQHACWRMWTQLACKLGSHINDPIIMNAVIAPMFDTIFTSGPQKCDPRVWDLCLTVFEDFVGCKLGDKSDVNYQTNSLRISGLDGGVPSPKTPSIRDSEKESAAEIKTDVAIKWESWGPSKLAFILKTLKRLWTCGSVNLHDSKNSSISLNGALRIWWLVVKGVTNVGSGTIDPPESHIESIHTLLKFFFELCHTEKSMTVQDKELSSAVWSFGEVLLIELRPLILCSSFYKLPTPFFDSDKNPSNVHLEGFFKSGDVVTPVVYLASAWLHFSFEASRAVREERMLERIEKLAIASCAGLDVMGNFHGHLCSLNHITYASSSSQCLDKKLLLENATFLLDMWNTFVLHLTLYLENVNDVPALRAGLEDSGYKVICGFLLYPLQSFPQVEFDVGGLSELASKAWIRLFDCTSRISSLKHGQPNSFTGSVCAKILKLLQWQESDNKALVNRCFLDMLTDVVVNILKQTQISSLASLAMSRKKRLGSYMGLSGTNGVDMDDSSNVRDIISLASRLLGLAKELFGTSIPSRILTSLAGFVSRIQFQKDILLFLQAVMKPLSEWLTMDQDKVGSLPLAVLDLLEKLWETILNCMQKCQPPITFDSNLLSSQASLLAPAFRHYHDPIANITIAFWEATYGTKPFLSYPFSLISVLQRLRRKVSISLPSFDQTMKGEAASGRLQNQVEESAIASLVQTYATGRRRRQMLQDEIDIIRKEAIAKPSSNSDSKGGGEQLKLDLSPSPLAGTSLMGKSLLNLAMEREIEAFNVRNYGIQSSPRQQVVNSELQIEKAKGRESEAIAEAPQSGERNGNQRDEILSGSKTQSQSGVDSTLGTTDDSTTENYLAAVAGRRKKLKFIDDNVEYVVFPPSQKTPGPLTEHQKEIKSAQHKCLKTYNYMDWSQNETEMGSELLPDMAVLEQSAAFFSKSIQKEEAANKKKGGLRSSAAITDAQTDCNKKASNEAKVSNDDRILNGEIKCNTAMARTRVRKQKTSEIMKLGVSQRRFLRSSGCLRGGKYWRIASEAEKQVRRKSLSSSPPVDKRLKRAVECFMTTSSAASIKETLEESPFRVRTLNRGYFAQIFSSAKKSNAVLDGHRHRKSILPKKAPLPNQGNPIRDGLCELNQSPSQKGRRASVSLLKRLKANKTNDIEIGHGDSGKMRPCSSSKGNGVRIEGNSGLCSETQPCGDTQIIQDTEICHSDGVSGDTQILEDGKESENKLLSSRKDMDMDMGELLDGLGSIAFHPSWKNAEMKDLNTAEVLLSALSDRLKKYKYATSQGSLH